MKRSLLSTLAFTVLTFSAPALSAPQTVDGTARSGLRLTIYNNGMALIDDRRSVVFDKGINILNLLGVSPGLIEGSARVVSSRPFNILEQGYLADNLSPSEVLKAHVGKPVTVIKSNPKTGLETAVDADLISIRKGIILRIDGHIETAPPGRIVFPQIPSHLHDQPIFRISGTAPTGGETGLGLSYLSNGYSWAATHTLTLNDTMDAVDLHTWASLKNTSGLDIKNAVVQVFAGDVQRRSRGIRSPQMPEMRLTKAMAADVQPLPGRQSLGGFHLYSLVDKIDLADKTQKQVSLLRIRALPISRELVSLAQANPHAPMRGTPNPTHPNIRLTLSNDKATGSSLPIPGGIARVYGQDRQGRSQFLGEDHLQDLPIAAKTSISIGRAFDVTVNRRQTDFRREGLGRNTFEMAYRLNVTNGGMRAEKVKIAEVMSGDWTILKQSHEHSREDNRAVWRVTIPPKGEVTITYRVRTKL